MTKCTEALRLLKALVDRIDLDDFHIKDSQVTKGARAFLADSVPACDAEKAVLVEVLDLELEAVESSIDNLEQCPSNEDSHCNDVTRVHDRLLRQRDDLNRVSANTSPAAAALLAQGERWRTALEFYADENNWPTMLVRNKGYNTGDPAVAAIHQDVGDRARAALAPGEAE